MKASIFRQRRDRGSRKLSLPGHRMPIEERRRSFFPARGWIVDMGEENRASERHTVTIPVLYANLTHPGTVTYSYQQSSTLDISASGVGLVLDEDIDKSDLVQVVMMLPVSPFVLTGLAQAIWSRQGQDDQFRAGLRFVQIPPELTEDLLKQIE